MTADEPAVIDENTNSATSVLRTVVLCDLVDSTALVERLGDQRAADLFRKHDRLARGLIQQHGGKEIDKTDGFLLIFERPIQAVAFALAYQHELAALGAQEQVKLASRIGIHIGDVVVWDNAPDDVQRGAKPTEVEGFVKPVAARLMGLALPSQILLSGVAYDIAHRAQGELGEKLSRVRWRTHGRYRFKGVPDLVPVFEVGEEGVAPLKAPPWSGKAHREMPFWRRPLVVGIEFLALALLVAAPIWYLTRPAPAIAFAQRDWVVVGDLKNLTGQASFDNSLETAFRMALEQSRYVNVLSDLKVRDTVKRMQRDPDQTLVDRALGSEIAIRDGARALILPTVAEIGGRVRITAEVVDPHTQTTVWSESADGTGAKSALQSIDQVNRELRARLGEALATVSESSKPLEKVATANLDALRMYSLAVQQTANGNYPDALNFYNEALRVDPGFAGVHLQLGRLLTSTGQRTKGLVELKQALAQRDRLTPRDAMLAAAHVASIESPRDSLNAWKVLADTYPDFTTGSGTYAYLAWQIANRYGADVVAKAQASASSQNPLQGPALHLLGILDLGAERYKEALAHFAAAEAAGLAFKPYHAATLMAMGDSEGGGKLLPAMPAAFDRNPALGTVNELLRLSMPFVRGDYPGAAAALEAARGITGAPPAFADALTFTDLALLQEAQDGHREGVVLQLTQARKAIKPGDVLQARVGAGRVLALAWLAARADAHQAASAALDELERHVDLSAVPALAQLRMAVKAQIALTQDHPADAIALLLPLLDGSELCIVRGVLLDAYRRQGDDAHALQQAQWLAQHPGRAYAEQNVDNMLLVFNVAHAHLALLTTAELSAKRGDQAGAKTWLGRFTQGWRENAAPAAILARVRTLQALLLP